MASDVSAGGWAKIFGGDRKQFDMFFDRMLDGFAYHKIVVNRAGKPVDYVFLEVNHAFEKMMGLKRERIIGKRATEVLPGFEKDPADLIDVYGRVALTGEPVQFETCIESLNKWFRVSAYCSEKGSFVTLIEDITERKQQEREIESLSRFPSENPNPIFRVDGNGTILYCNKVGCSFLASWTSKVGERVPEHISQAVADALASDKRVELKETRGTKIFLLLLAPVISEGYVNIYANDITERKKAEEALRKLNRHLKAVSNSTQALMHATDEAKFTQEVCNIIIEDCGYALVWVGFAEHDEGKTVRPVAFAGFDKGYIDALKVTWDGNSERGRGPTGTVIRTGKPYICKNMQIDPNFEPWRREALKRGYTASLVLPLISFEGETFGALNIYSKESEPFTDEEVKLLTELANDFSYGIGMLRLRKKREQAEETLRKQASLIDLSPDAIIVRRLDGAITFWSKGAEKMYGWTKAEAIGQVTHTLLKTEFPIPLEEIENKQKLEGKWSGELVQTCKDGGKVVVQSFQLAQFGEDGKIESILESNIDITQRKQQEREVKNLAKFPSENPNPVFRIDGNGTILYCNKVGCSFLAVWNSKVGERVPEHISQVVADTLAFDKRVEVEETFGAKTFSLLFVPVILEGYVNVYGNDVTERKKAEEALKESEHLYRTVFDNSQDGFQLIELIYDETGNPYDHKFLRVNRAYEKIIGVKAKDITGNTARSVSPNCESYWFEVPDRVVKTGKSEHVELYNGDINKTLDCYYFPYSKNVVGTLFRDVTERKKTEEKLRVASLYSRSLIEASLDPLVTISSDGKITDVNKATESVTGFSRRQLIGSDFSDYFTDSEKARKGYQEVFAQGFVRDYPLAIRHKTGQITDVLYNATLFRNEAGDIQGVFAAARDVTERKQAEETLRKQAALIDLSPDGIIVKRLDDTITFWSQGAEKLYGWTKEEVIGQQTRDLFKTTFPDSLDNIINQLKHTGKWSGELIHLAKDGNEVIVQSSWLATFDKNGELIEILESNVDITERKHSEEKLNAASLYSRSLIEASLDPLVTISADGKITDVNKSTEDVTGVPRDQLIGSDFSNYFTEPEEARKGYRKVFTEGFVVDFPLAIRHKSGKVTDVLYNASIYKNEAGEVQGVFAAARDITVRKAMENEIKQTMEKLQQSNAELEQFAYVASHDLQEPLRMVASYVQLLERRYKGKLDPDADEFIAYAVDGANRMRGLIDDLLTYSRVGRLGKPFEPTDLESTLDIVLLNLQASIADSGAVVTHDKLPVVMADVGQLVQLFQNLIGNAIKFHGKEPPRVHVSVQVKENEYLFSVRDNGIGIAPEYFDRLFKIFQRLHTREEYPGTGIGLAICKKIVERHGGRIWIESQVGKGSTIYFTLNKQKRSMKEFEKN